MIQLILFLRAVASIRLFLIQLAIIVGDKFNPKMLFTSSEFRIFFLGFSKGEELFAPEILTEYSSNPADCIKKSRIDATAYFIFHSCCINSTFFNTICNHCS